MYLPSSYREERAEVVHGLIEAHSFAALVSHGPSGLLATHLPLILERERGPQGTLFGHMARNNPQWRDLSPGDEVLAVFSGPSAYVSPRWYSAEPDVPTWNYGAVHVYGTWRAVTEPGAVRRLLERTIARYEAHFPPPWSLASLDPGLVEGLERHIVAFDVEVVRILCAMKLSQDKQPEDVAGVLAGLEESGEREAQETALLMRRVLGLPGR